MPTTIGTGGYVLMVSFWVLHLFYHCFLMIVNYFFQLINFGPNTGTSETQPTDISLAFPPHRQHTNNNGHRSVCFCGEFLSSSPFLPLFLAMSQLFFSIKFLRSHHGIGQNSAHNWSLASCPHLWHANKAAVGMFWWWVFFLHLFYNSFQLHLSYFLQLNNYGPNIGTAETQPTDWSLASRPHRRHNNGNRQRRVCFDCEFLHFEPFLTVFSYVPIIFSIKFLRPHNGNSAHRLKFGLPPSLPTRQRQ
jgi:hypothetical protein